MKVGTPTLALRPVERCHCIPHSLGEGGGVSRSVAVRPVIAGRTENTGHVVLSIVAQTCKGELSTPATFCAHTCFAFLCIFVCFRVNEQAIRQPKHRPQQRVNKLCFSNLFKDCEISAHT